MALDALSAAIKDIEAGWGSDRQMDTLLLCCFGGDFADERIHIVYMMMMMILASALLKCIKTCYLFHFD